MSQEVVGLVEEVMNNGKAKGSGVRISGYKYGVYDPADSGLAEVSVGTTVSLRFKETEKSGITYKNVQGRITTVKDGTPVTASTVPIANTGGSAKSGYRKNGEAGGFPIHAHAYERALDRRNALNCAVTAAEGHNFTPEDLIELACKFEAYTTGDVEANAASALAFNEDTVD